MNQSTGHYQSSMGSIGSIAAEVLSSTVRWEILGVTSRGVFLKSSEKWVIFVTSDPFPGPCTISLPGAALPVAALQTGTLVTISPLRLTFHSIQAALDLHHIPTWQPPPSPVVSSRQLQNTRLETLASLIQANQHDDSWLANYLKNLGISFPFVNPGKDLPPSPTSPLRGLGEGWEGGKALLGLGPGLTPSGDDFIIGFLLILNRWPELSPNPKMLSSINEQLVRAAYQKTTTISANLIECASRGLADVRLIQAADYLVAGLYDVNHMAYGLLTWGSSSGVDAFIGMSAGIQDSAALNMPHQG